MKRSISVMVGKGSVNHNSRKFNAKNTDPERTPQNISYCNESIRAVYRSLFDEALERYNARQTRADRKIEDYYEKIRSGKQEKPFHEIILQIGNCDNTGATTEVGARARAALDEFYREFAKRNPNLRVFSAHLHMDEATPHLHIDFVPFITGSKRGLDTRVSLKQALAAQGFKGGTRGDTEWNQWVRAEKEQLAAVMERHGFEWEQHGTHEKHLSVLDYEKKTRTEEVAALTEQITELEEQVASQREQCRALSSRIQNYNEEEKNIDSLKQELDFSPDYAPPEPTAFMSARSYKNTFVEPLIRKLKQLVLTVLTKYHEMADSYYRLRSSYEYFQRKSKRLEGDNAYLTKKNAELQEKNRQLRAENKDFALLRRGFGKEQIDRLLLDAKERSKRQKYYERG